MIEAVIILGMHRSGTSCLTGCLKNFGLTLGNVSTYNKYNLKGNQEDRKVFRLNEFILKHNGGSWQNPVPINSVTEEQLNKREEVLKQYNLLNRPWGIKDPRMLLTYFFWKEFLPPHEFVGTFRHPLSVAESLQARKNLTVTKKQSLYLWSYYNQKLIEHHERSPFPVINFDLTADEYQDKVTQIAKNLKLEGSGCENFYDIDLKNQQSYSIKECPENLKGLYEKLLSIAL